MVDRLTADQFGAGDTSEPAGRLREHIKQAHGLAPDEHSHRRRYFQHKGDHERFDLEHDVTDWYLYVEDPAGTSTDVEREVVALLHQLYAREVDWAYDDNGRPIDPTVKALHERFAEAVETEPTEVDPTCTLCEFGEDPGHEH